MRVTYTCLFNVLETYSCQTSPEAEEGQSCTKGGTQTQISLSSRK